MNATSGENNQGWNQERMNATLGENNQGWNQERMNATSGENNQGWNEERRTLPRVKITGVETTKPNSS